MGGFLIRDLIIKGKYDTFYTPAVHFQAKNGQCSLTGESFLENAFDFYDKLTHWINDYFAHGGKLLDLEVNLNYFNTGTSRAILYLLKCLSFHENQGKSISVKWYYPASDLDTKIEIEELKEEAHLDIEIIPHKEV